MVGQLKDPLSTPLAQSKSVPSATIVSLALLKVNWDKRRTDYVGAFIPLVAECIRQSADEVVSLPDTQAALRTKFGLTLPQHAIKAILHRVARAGYVRVQNHVYYRNSAKLAELDFERVQKRVLQMHETVVQRLVEFCQERFQVNWTTADADEALKGLLEAYRLIITSDSESGSAIPRGTPRSPNARYFVGAFIQHLRDTRSGDLEFVDTIVKGNMVANAMFLADPSQALKKFHQTQIFFDTAFMMFALGYTGPSRRDPCVELLQLLYETGADLRVFRHTLEEIRRALDACVRRMKGTLHDTYGPGIETVEYFFSQGYTSSDVELLSANLERNVEGLRIQIVERPEYHNHRYVIDEKKLHDSLREAIAYRNEDAIERDVQTVSAVIRLRRGVQRASVEDCVAVFVTTNTNLIRVVRESLANELAPHTVAPCISDYALTNILWLKKPTAAPDLPRKRVVADSYAALQPSEDLWRAFTTEITKLQSQGTITEDDYYLLRHSLATKPALMQLTHGEVEAFSEGTAAELLELARANIAAKEKAELNRKLEDELATRGAIEDELRGLKAREELRKTRRVLLARKAGRLAAITTGAILIALILLGTWALSPMGPSGFGLRPWRWLLIGVALIAVVAGLVHLITGRSVISVIRSFQSKFERWTYWMLAKVAEG
jgi:hypothetical protein